MNKPGKQAQSAARNERLSAALRENLKRRKEQARGQAASGGSLAGEDFAARDAGVSGDDPDFRRNPGPESGTEGRSGAGRRGT